LDATSIAVGGGTILHVYAQVVPAQRAKVDRIFSWYLDLVNSNGSAADSSGTPTKATSDRTAQTSSSGVMDGVNRRGIYDTFMDLAGAGVSNAVELFSVPIKGLAQGNVTFKVQAGTGVSGLSQDFIVAPIGGGVPLVGGDYSQATATLAVGSGVCQPMLTSGLTVQPAPAQFVLNFTVCPGKTHTVEFTDDLAHPSWQTLGAGANNSGRATDTLATSSAGKRFYRVRVE
jgi:hypothetical protein